MALMCVCVWEGGCWVDGGSISKNRPSLPKYKSPKQFL